MVSYLNNFCIFVIFLILRFCSFYVLIYFLSSVKFQNVYHIFVAFLLTMHLGLCEKVSPKPGLKLFREDYKSVEETCLAVGFVRNNCKNETMKSMATY